MPKISVIMPAYNSSNFIKEAVKSILDQTYKDFEVIIIDDGSVDNTKRITHELVQTCPDKIKYFYQEHKGVAAARNLGIINADGKYLAFLDADDIWLPSKLELQVAHLESHLDIALIYSDLSTFNETGILEKDFYLSKNIPRPTGNIFKQLLSINFIATSTVMLRTSVLNNVGFFDESLAIGEDYHLWLRIAHCYRIGHLPQVVTMYRQHQSNTTRNNNALSENPWEVKVIEKILALYPAEKKANRWYELNRRLARPYFEIGYRYFKERNFHSAKKYFKKAALLYPLKLSYVAAYLICFGNHRLIACLTKIRKIIK